MQSRADAGWKFRNQWNSTKIRLILIHRHVPCVCKIHWFVMCKFKYLSTFNWRRMHAQSLDWLRIRLIFPRWLLTLSSSDNGAAMSFKIGQNRQGLKFKSGKNGAKSARKSSIVASPKILRSNLPNLSRIFEAAMPDSAAQCEMLKSEQEKHKKSSTDDDGKNTQRAGKEMELWLNSKSWDLFYCTL